jgi:Asp-tRNA(Asn)/Glu-tRNA(Gln) amidotransferase A subunit family amidase
MDAAIVTTVLAGPAPEDFRTLDLPRVPNLISAATPVVWKGRVAPRWRLEVGVPAGFADGTSATALARSAMLDVLADIGYEIVRLTLPEEYVLLNGGAFNVSSTERGEMDYKYLREDVRPFGEEKIVSVIAAFQAVTDYHLRRPPNPTIGLARASDPRVPRIRLYARSVDAEIEATALA